MPQPDDAAEGPDRVEHMPRLRGAPAPIEASLDPKPRRRSALPRALAAVVLVLLMGATGLVFTMSRPLADVDIEAVTLIHTPCRGSEPCSGLRRASVRGTVAVSSGSRDVTVVVLVRRGPQDEWSVAAETRPDESGAWAVADLVVPPRRHRTCRSEPSSARLRCERTQSARPTLG
jgi:hypothetical protein